MFFPGNMSQKMPEAFLDYLTEDDYLSLPEDFRHVTAFHQSSFCQLLENGLSINQISNDTVPLLNIILEQQECFGFVISILQQYGNLLNSILRISCPSFIIMCAHQDAIIHFLDNKITLEQLENINDYSDENDEKTKLWYILNNPNGFLALHKDNSINQIIDMSRVELAQHLTPSAQNFLS